MNQLPLVAINGPTAAGKSATAVRLARGLIEDGVAAEIVNADSMLVYRGMDIGTAKPTHDEREGVPHHLIDLWEVRHSATVAEFQQLARTAITQVRDRGAVPILVGGSALYVRAILDDFTFPGTDPQVRARLEAELLEHGAAALHQRLAGVDPQAAAGILPGNGRRIVRALEVVELTGGYSATLPGQRYALQEVLEVGLHLERAEMDQRIERRVLSMWEQGFVAEVKSLVGQGLREGRTAPRALGYRQILTHLDGELSEEEARQATVSGTRRFARKQLSWFRREPRITWFAAGQRAAREIRLVLDARLTTVVGKEER